ncbi:MAG: hypothetical protein BVN35_05900 [Proteobacteria bacterium ST_bin11]|nr:MAG: hypothetical protein BVN35_05900 [Proteobacteria bacterium ST_bin11]
MFALEDRINLRGFNNLSDDEKTKILDRIAKNKQNNVRNIVEFTLEDLTITTSSNNLRKSRGIEDRLALLNSS